MYWYINLERYLLLKILKYSEIHFLFYVNALLNTMHLQNLMTLKQPTECTDLFVEPVE